MTTKATRRRFFLSAGAAVAAPTALVPDTISANTSSIDLHARIEALEDAEMLRRLVSEFAALVNSSGDTNELLNAAVVEIEPGDYDTQAAIRFSPDRRAAEISVPCSVATHEPIDAPESGLADMARLHGGGFVREEHRQQLMLQAGRTESGWAVTRATLVDSS